VYFGQYVLTANLSAEADSRAPLSMTLRPPSPPAIPPASESPSLAPSRSSRRSSGESAESKSGAAGLPPSLENSPSSPIDIETAYAVARQSSKSSRGMGSQSANPEPPALESETPLGRSIAKSARPDCRTAHAGLGLFAIPFLIADTITDRGCKW